MIKSCVTFFRRQLKIKGKSIHNGRGMYEMGFDISINDLKERIDNLIAAHPDMVDVVKGEDFTSVTIKEEFAPDQFYRTLQFFPRNPYYTLNVVMAF